MEYLTNYIYIYKLQVTVCNLAFNILVLHAYLQSWIKFSFRSAKNPIPHEYVVPIRISDTIIE